MFVFLPENKICESFTCAMRRESGEHSLSILLVLSLWALEFCLSFIEVLRGRLCSLFSILLRMEQNTRSSKYMTGRAAVLTSWTWKLTKRFIKMVEKTPCPDYTFKQIKILSNMHTYTMT